MFSIIQNNAGYIMNTKFKIVVISIALVCISQIIACHTVHGIGQDISVGGNKIQKVSEPKQN